MFIQLLYIYHQPSGRGTERRLGLTAIGLTVSVTESEDLSLLVQGRNNVQIYKCMYNDICIYHNISICITYVEYSMNISVLLIIFPFANIRIFL